jgi:hypothetical protein
MRKKGGKMNKKRKLNVKSFFSGNFFFKIFVCFSQTHKKIREKQQIQID